ncbi:MAG TPA: YIP1 family protein [Terriglobales bacterium]
MSSSTPPPSFAPAPLSSEHQQPGLSEPARILNTFVAPSKTFLDIRQNGSWWVPWLLISIFSIAFWIVVDKKVGFDQIARTTMTNNKQFDQQSPEQQTRTLSLVASITKYSGYFSPVIVLLTALIIALVLWITFNFAMGAEIPFGRAMAIVLYGWLPTLIGAILSLIAVWFGNPEGFRIDSPVGTNPAHFMDPQTTSKFVLGMLSSLDVIGLWIVILIGIGFALNAKKRLSLGSSIGIVATWYFISKLVSAALAAARG